MNRLTKTQIDNFPNIGIIFILEISKYNEKCCSCYEDVNTGEYIISELVCTKIGCILWYIDHLLFDGIRITMIKELSESEIIKKLREYKDMLLDNDEKK